MNRFTKKTAVGIATAAAAAALTAGIAAPAMAATGHDTAAKVSPSPSSSSTVSSLTPTQFNALRSLLPGTLGNGTAGSLPLSVTVGLNIGGLGHANSFGLGDGIPLLPGNLTSAATSGANPASSAAKSAGSTAKNLVGSATSGSGLGTSGLGASGLGSAGSNVTGVLGGILGNLGIG